MKIFPDYPEIKRSLSHHVNWLPHMQHMWLFMIERFLNVILQPHKKCNIAIYS